jgi:hypothetical protein
MKNSKLLEDNLDGIRYIRDKEIFKSLNEQDDYKFFDGSVQMLTLVSSAESEKPVRVDEHHLYAPEGVTLITERGEAVLKELDMEKSRLETAKEVLCRRISEIKTENELIELLRDTMEELVEQKPSLTLPDPVKDYGKYELWKDRENKNELALDFLRRVWGKYIDAGDMGQADLRGYRGKDDTHVVGLDEALYEAVKRQCKKENSHVSIYLPTKSKKIDRKLATIVGQGKHTETQVARLGMTLVKRQRKGMRENSILKK